MAPWDFECQELPRVVHGRIWQPGPVPLPQPAAGQLGASGWGHWSMGSVVGALGGVGRDGQIW